MTRLISGLVLALAALVAIWFLPTFALRLLVAAVAALGAREVLTILRAGDLRPAPWLAMAFTAGSSLAMGDVAARYNIVVLAGLGVMLIEVLARGNGLAAAGAVVGGAIWVGVPLGLLARVHDIGGPSAVLLLLGTVVVSDSSQYYTGRLLGRHLLAPTVSPKKTIEGALGGVVFGTAAMVLGGRWVLPYVGVPLLVGTGLAVVLLGICGDLFESRLKRLAGLKDSSSLIPGHGGVLDRIDALLFAAPAFYLLLGSSL
ncbi:MAG: phosphatidate cytidylyltransferase [Vicinamibacterales bacterium]